MKYQPAVPPDVFVNFSTNGLIFQLSEEDRNRLQQICQPVVLSEGEILCAANDKDLPKVYFLNGACVTLWVENPEQGRLAVGLVGSEGAIGLGAALGLHAEHMHFEVQTTGQAWCTDSRALQNLLQSRPSMLWTVARYLWQVARDIASMAATIQHADIPARLAAWLVLCAQRSESQQLSLTHDQLAGMMGVRRVSITLAAVALKGLGLIDYKRGVVTITDMAGLEKRAHGGAPTSV
jgi:CRP-like cAMP-binding protein